MGIHGVRGSVEIERRPGRFRRPHAVAGVLGALRHGEHQRARQVEIGSSIGLLLNDQDLDERRRLTVEPSGIEDLGQLNDIQQRRIDSDIVGLPGVGLGQSREEGAFGGGVFTRAQGVPAARREFCPRVGGGRIAWGGSSGHRLAPGRVGRLGRVVARRGSRSAASGFVGSPSGGGLIVSGEAQARRKLEIVRQQAASVAARSGDAHRQG